MAQFSKWTLTGISVKNDLTVPLNQLIRHMNERSNETGIHVLYSSPSCYLQALTQGQYLKMLFTLQISDKICKKY